MLGLTDLWEAIGTRLKDDQQDTDGDSDLFQLEVVGHPGPPQHPPHTIPGGHGKLTEANGKAVQLSSGQTQTVDQRLGQSTCEGIEYTNKNPDSAIL